jgi:hypothetical protein
MEERGKIVVSTGLMDKQQTADMIQQNRDSGQWTAADMQYRRVYRARRRLGLWGGLGGPYSKKCKIMYSQCPPTGKEAKNKKVVAKVFVPAGPIEPTTRISGPMPACCTLDEVLAPADMPAGMEAGARGSAI